MNKEILKRIEDSKKDYDKKSQRAELLIRSERFQQEFNKFFNWLPDVNKFFIVKKKYPEGFKGSSPYSLPIEIERISKNNILIKLKYSKYKHKNWITRENKYLNIRIGDDEYKIKWEIIHRAHAFDKHFREWIEFCDRWSLNYTWNGKLKSTQKHLRNPVEIYYNKDYFRDSFEDKEKWAFFLRFNAWTTLEDIKDKWRLVELIQKRILGKHEKKANFCRDLVWYDLYKEHNLKPKQIAELWIRKFPKDIDLLVIRRIINREDDLKGVD